MVKNEDRQFSFLSHQKPYGQYDGKLDPKTEAGLEHQRLDHQRENFQHQRIAGDYDEIISKIDLGLDRSHLKNSQYVPK